TFDWQQMQIRTTGGTQLAQPLFVDSNSQTWTLVTVDMTPYAGQTVVLYFNVHQDGYTGFGGVGDQTGMYLDDISLNAVTLNVPPRLSSTTALNLQGGTFTFTSG